MAEPERKRTAGTELETYIVSINATTILENEDTKEKKVLKSSEGDLNALLDEQDVNLDTAAIVKAMLSNASGKDKPKVEAITYAMNPPQMADAVIHDPVYTINGKTVRSDLKEPIKRYFERKTVAIDGVEEPCMKARIVISRRFVMGSV
ncbi:MAG: hypothetical protein HY438_02430 [DPANN group archaeon]|nr:hypothetical protein [DPANN group archaeon]